MEPPATLCRSWANVDLMPVKAEMKRIDEAVEESFDTARKHDAKRKAKSRRTVYRKALDEVQQIAGNDPMRELGEWIRTQIRDHDRAPSGRDVRQKGAEICRSNGKSISTGSWLGA